MLASLLSRTRGRLGSAGAARPLNRQQSRRTGVKINAASVFIGGGPVQSHTRAAFSVRLLGSASSSPLSVGADPSFLRALASASKTASDRQQHPRAHGAQESI